MLLFIRGIDLIDQFLKSGSGTFNVERFILRLAEYFWEIVGDEATQKEIGISDR